MLGFDCGGQQWVLEVAFPTGAVPFLAPFLYLCHALLSPPPPPPLPSACSGLKTSSPHRVIQCQHLPVAEASVILHLSEQLRQG